MVRVGICAINKSVFVKKEVKTRAELYCRDILEVVLFLWTNEHSALGKGHYNRIRRYSIEQTSLSSACCRFTLCHSQSSRCWWRKLATVTTNTLDNGHTSMMTFLCRSSLLLCPVAAVQMDFAICNGVCSIASLKCSDSVWRVRSAVSNRRPTKEAANRAEWEEHSKSWEDISQWTVASVSLMISLHSTLAGLVTPTRTRSDQSHHWIWDSKSGGI